jgi:exodeoxyribonuclease-3
MTIVTWNVNSLKVRLSQVLAWVTENRPDVLCLQETKLSDPSFPVGEFQELGYEAAFSGQPTYNGVAILSRKPVHDVTVGFPDWADDHRRMIQATVDGVRIVNVYVPNGQDLNTPKYAYKLEWLDHLIAMLRGLDPTKKPVALLGDFNIAPGDRDVWDPEGIRGQLFVSDPERSRLSAILDLGFVDLYRARNPGSKAFSWWDYRMGSFRRDRGLRIDLILGSLPMSDACLEVAIDRAARTHERPSDHAPVTARFGSLA